MSYDEEAVLLTVESVERNEACIPQEKLMRTEVYVGRKSTTRTEAYKAMSEGIATVVTLGLHTSEYEAAVCYAGNKEPKYVEYEGRRYRIIRIYGENSEEMELVLKEG